MTVRHETVRLEKVFETAPTLAFSAWSSSDALARWYLPGDTEWRSRISEHDFRVGGRKHLFFGPQGQTPYEEDCRYEDIVPNERIIFSMTISGEGRRQTVSIVTVEFLPFGKSTKILVTDQLAIIDGRDTAQGRELGWKEVLVKLSGELKTSICEG